MERDNIGLNDAIQRAMQTVDQLRDADRNIDFARQLTENLDEIENSDGELGHGVLQIGILKFIVNADPEFRPFHRIPHFA